MRYSILLSLLLLQTARAEDTIYVKATKEQKTLNQTQESLVIIKKDSIKAPTLSENLEVLEKEANINVNREDDTFTIRGVKNTGVTGYQKDNLASVLVDRVFQTDLAVKAGSFNTYDLESIEILRGAQSVGQGINSLAGSVNLFHQAPDFDNSGNLRAEVGSFGKRKLQFFQNATLIEDKLASKVSGSAHNQSGYITNKTTNNDDWAKKDQYNLNLDFLLFLNADDQIKFSNKAFQSIHGGNYVHGPDPKKYEVYEDMNTTIRTKNAQSIVEYENIINEEWSNIFVVNYSNSKQITSSDSDLTSLNRSGERADKHRDNFSSAENLMKFKGRNLSNSFGVHWHRYSLIDSYDFNVLPITNNAVNLNIKQYVDRKQNIYSLFDSFTYDIGNDHTISSGARFEYVKSNYLTNVRGSRVGTSGNAGTDSSLDAYVIARSGAYGGENSGGKILPKISYLYHLNKEVGLEKNIGLSYNEGYRTGGVSINRYRTVAVNYDPETTKNYELSFKNQYSKASFNTNFFYSNWKKQQVQVSLSSDSYDTQVENASSSEYYGVETEVSTTVSNSHEFSWNLGYVKTRFLDFKSRTRSYDGNEFPNAPRFTSSFFHRLTFLETYNLKTTLRYLGQSFADAENSKRIKEQYYIDMSAQKKFNQLTLEFQVKNILNKKYELNKFSNTYGTYYQMSLPREFSAAVSYNW